MRNNDKNCLIAGNNEMKKRVHFIFLKHNRKLKFMLDVSSIFMKGASSVKNMKQTFWQGFASLIFVFWNRINQASLVAQLDEKLQEIFFNYYRDWL